MDNDVQPGRTESQVLWEAHDLIAQGWMQFAPSTRVGTHVFFCATGAIAKTMPSGCLVNAVCRALVGSLHEWWEEWTMSLGIELVNGRLPSGLTDSFMLQTWNDSPGRTQEEVLNLFAKTAIRLEEQGR